MEPRGTAKNATPVHVQLSGFRVTHGRSSYTLHSGGFLR
jgi:hypothetical protein